MTPIEQLKQFQQTISKLRKSLNRGITLTHLSLDVVTIYTMPSQGIVGYLTQQNPTEEGESRSDTPIKQQQQWWTTNEKPMALLVANALT